MHHIGGGEGGVLEGHVEGAGAAQPHPVGEPQPIAESAAGVDMRHMSILAEFEAARTRV